MSRRAGAPSVCAVVLAAGLSRRMGNGVQKLLLPFGASTVLGHVVDQIVAAEVGEVIVVVGTDQRVAAAVEGRPVRVVRNEEPGADMLGSARRGLRALAALPEPCNAVLLALGDQPAVTPGLVRGLIAAFSAAGRGIVVPVYEGRRGHPLLFGSHYAAEVLARYDGVGVRGLPRSHPDDVFELHVRDPAVAADVDFPEDYRREVERFEADRQSTPCPRTPHAGDAVPRGE